MLDLRCCDLGLPASGTVRTVRKEVLLVEPPVCGIFVTAAQRDLATLPPSPFSVAIPRSSWEHRASRCPPSRTSGGLDSSVWKSGARWAVQVRDFLPL